MIAGLNYLIVDDDPSTIDGLRGLLERLEAKSVTVARTGRQGFHAITGANNRFDCVIADVRMPDGNGLELLHHIRTATTVRGFRPDMCIVLMSGVASAEVIALARQLDVSAFLVKPFTMTSLQTAVAAARRRVFPLDHNRYLRIAPFALQNA